MLNFLHRTLIPHRTLIRYTRVMFSQVTWGLSLQFVFALLILRWPLGKSVVDCLGQKIDSFLGFTNQGSSFVYGYLVSQQIFNPDRFENSTLAYNITSEINMKKAVPSVVVFSALRQYLVFWLHFQNVKFFQTFQ